MSREAAATKASGRDVMAKGCQRAPGQVWPLWKLILIALPQLGVQALWCFICAKSAPYMLHLGVGHALATLNNAAGPTLGLFAGPIVGVASDSCTSKYGRRRPVVLAGLVSIWIAGMLFSLAEHMLSGPAAVALAAPMYWVLDVTINVLQTPHRALVADLASEEQQLPMQVVFVVFIAMGNFIGFSSLRIYDVPVEHMRELMLGFCALNALCVGVQLLVAREVPLAGAPRQSLYAPVVAVARALRGSPRLLYHLATVQCLVWVGNTAWNIYGGQWFTSSVFQGDQHAPEGSDRKDAYREGNAAFSHGGQARAVLQLISALAIIMLLLRRWLRPRLVLALCIFVGCVASLLAAFAVGHSGAFAMVCLALSVVPAAGSFAIPFGLVATLNKRAEEEGKQVSTGLQMALLSCCVLVGQQLCTTSLAAIQGKLSLEAALPCVFMLAVAAQVIAGCGALCLDDTPPAEAASDMEAESSQDTVEEGSTAESRARSPVL